MTRRLARSAAFALALLGGALPAHALAPNTSSQISNTINQQIYTNGTNVISAATLNSLLQLMNASYCNLLLCYMQGQLVALPSTAGLAGLNLGSGVTPTAPLPGDVWTTSGGMFVSLNGITYSMAGANPYNNNSTWEGSAASATLIGGWGSLTAVGSNVLTQSTSGYNDTCVGAATCAIMTTGYGNVAVGTSALTNAVAGYSNVAVGAQAGQSISSGGQNTYLGTQAGFTGATVFGNTAVGFTAGYSATGSNNVTLGYSTGYGISSGTGNTLLGAEPLGASYNQVTTGSQNIAIGYNVAVPSATANGQIVIGNAIYCTGATGTGATPSTALCGTGAIAPTYAWDVTGTSRATAALLARDTTATDGYASVVPGSATLTGAVNFYAASSGALLATLGGTTGTGVTMTLASGNFNVTGGFAAATSGFLASGTPPTASGTCAITSQTGGQSAGAFTMSGACTNGTIILTFTTTAPTGWACTMSDRTAPTALFGQTATSATSATMTNRTVATGASDVVQFACAAY